MSKFIGLHTVNYGGTCYDENGEPYVDKHVSKDITYINFDLVEEIAPYGDNVTILLFGPEDRELVEGTPEQIFCSIV